MTTLTHCSRCGRPIRAVTRDSGGPPHYVNHARRCLFRDLAPDVPATRAVQRGGGDEHFFTAVEEDETASGREAIGP